MGLRHSFFQIKDKNKQIHEITSSVICRQQDAIYGHKANITIFGLEYVDFDAEISVNPSYRNRYKGSLLLSAYFRTIQELEKVYSLVCEQISGDLIEQDWQAGHWILSLPFYANLSNHTYDAPDFNLACEFYGNKTHKSYPIEEGKISKEDFEKALETPTSLITNKVLLPSVGVFFIPH